MIGQNGMPGIAKALGSLCGNGIISIIRAGGSRIGITCRWSITATSVARSKGDIHYRVSEIIITYLSLHRAG